MKPDKLFDGSDAHLLTKKGKPDMRRKEYATPEIQAKRIACAKKAGLSKLAHKAARDAEADYAKQLFQPAMRLLAKIEAKEIIDDMSEVTTLLNRYYGDVRPDTRGGE